MKATHVRKIRARLERIRGALPCSLDDMAAAIARVNGGGGGAPWRPAAADLARLLGTDVPEFLDALDAAQGEARDLRRLVRAWDSSPCDGREYDPAEMRGNSR